MGIFNEIKLDWSANFDELEKCCGSKNIDALCNGFYEAYCKQFTSADYLKKVEWILRNYQASKRIILSALFYKQSEYLRDRHAFLGVKKPGFRSKPAGLSE
ncbi:MAG: hypothetical protein AABY55_05360 [Candidatus Omnitrophota bacterium]